MRVVEKGRELSRGAVGRVLHPGQELSHIGVDRLIGGVRGDAVVLVGVAGVVQVRLVNVFEGDVGVYVLPDVAVGSRTPGVEVDVLASDEVLDDVRAAVSLLGILGHLCGADVGVHGCQAPIGLDVVEENVGHPDGRGRMSEVKESARRAHRAEGPGGDDVHLFGDLVHTLLPDEVHDLFGSADYRFSRFYLLVDLLIGFRH